MTRTFKLVFISIIIAVLSGCVYTGNKNVDGAILGVQGLVGASSAQKKKKQEAFRQDLDKKLNQAK